MQSGLTVVRSGSIAPSKRTLVVGLLMLDTFVLGGAAALVLVNSLIVTIMHRLVSGDAQGEVLNVLDHLLPYYLAYGLAALGLTVCTSLALGLYTRSWRLAGLPLLFFAALCALQMLVS